ncbi:hypothetical protein TVAG_008730 [Trichomonas vaginalis G3]|uniref:UBA domain-containing protein n=1 Tax=Trichomonas vaginalis (strain ATCC PRA-98 / G3) TaxID=412133 RepID=A2F7U6_TRIV3|nr:UBA-like family [Trichomonas vaginalis G3]EAX99025.1 hypothetical protein TVAG_008730 [Trichomonas vaginalis G3]KAI5539499.1 UBA-like family [Trichomonas vaginalis G3]|eukprot:XP_001311955.1 hypothetical protein [Trichomonas vaginalis G3]
MDVRVKFSETENAMIKIARLITLHSLKMMVSKFTRVPMDSITIYAKDKQITENDNIFNLIKQNGNEIIVKYVDAAHSVKDKRDATLFNSITESYAICNPKKYANDSTLSPNQEYLLNLGFNSYMVTNALQTCDNDLSKALGLLLSHPTPTLHINETSKRFADANSEKVTTVESDSDESQSEAVVSKETEIEQEKIKKEAARLENLEHNIFKDKETYQSVLKIINKINESSKKSYDQESTTNDQEASDNDSYSSTMQNMSNNLITKPLTGRRFRGVTVIRQVPEPKSFVGQSHAPQIRSPENIVTSHQPVVETPQKTQSVVNPTPTTATTLNQQPQNNPILQQNITPKSVENPPNQANPESQQKSVVQQQKLLQAYAIQMYKQEQQQMFQQNSPQTAQQILQQLEHQNPSKSVQQNPIQVMPPTQQQIAPPNPLQLIRSNPAQIARPNMSKPPEPAKQKPVVNSDDDSDDDVEIIGFKKHDDISSQQPILSRQPFSQAPNSYPSTKVSTETNTKQNKITKYMFSQQPISNSQSPNSFNTFQSSLSRTENLRIKMCIAYAATPDKWDQIIQKVPGKTIFEIQNEIILIQNNPKYSRFLEPVDTEREPQKEELENIARYYREYNNNYAAIASKLIKRTPQSVENIIKKYLMVRVE